MAVRKKSIAFSEGVSGKLKSYVYRLIDPRNGETFYVGKGKDNRVFAHVRAESGLDGDDSDNKIRIIRDIKLSGFEVAHVIHRHGMDSKTAEHVEAALMDAYPGLSNVAGGVGSSSFGAMHAEEIIRRYEAEEADLRRHRVLMINVSKTALELPLLEATRYAWKVDVRRAERAEVVLATRQGLIIGAFVATRWLPAVSENFPGRAEEPGRYGFVGRDADPEIQAAYVGKRVPDALRKKGAANPIRYTYK